MSVWRWAAGIVIVSLLQGCAATDGSPPPGDPATENQDPVTREFFPLVSGRTWIFAVIDEKGEARDRCALTVEAPPGPGAPYPLKGLYLDAAASFEGSLHRQGKDLMLGYGAVALPVLREPFEDGSRWEFSVRDRGRVLMGRATARVEDSPSWLPVGLAGPGDRAVAVRLTLSGAGQTTFEEYRFLEGVGFVGLGRSADGRNWTWMNLERFEDEDEPGAGASG